MNKYIILNFAYGFGPFLRTTELALEINHIFSQMAKDRMGIIVPLVYGERQKEIMLEEFGEIIKKYPDEIVFDKKLGELLNSIFYGDINYEDSIKYYLKNFEKIQKELDYYLKAQLIVENFEGFKFEIQSKNISMCLTRAPRVNFNINPSYSAGFGYISDILENSLNEEKIGVDKVLLKNVIPIYKKIEQSHNLNFIAEPSTFSYIKNYGEINKDTIFTPPNFKYNPNLDDCENFDKGIYATVTGIPNLDYLFADIKKIGLKIYSNNEKIVGSQKALPSILNCKKTILHFARSGWGSIWLSLFSKTPFITPEYFSKDDPEIYFNNICLEKLDLGLIYKNQSFVELLKFKEKFTKSVEQIISKLLNKYGTTDGVNYTAKKIINHYLTI